MSKVGDRGTFSNFESVQSTHVHFNWNIDWEKRNIHGNVVHTLAILEEGAKEVIFDTRFLDISSIKVEDKEVKFELKPEHHTLGSALHVPLEEVSGKTVKVTIKYSTTSKCTALDWLQPAQTASKRFPFFYSQCQAIHARSIAPLQDTPGVKITYSASAKSKLPILFSALRRSPPSEAPPVYDKEITYEYEQPIKIPSYLIAIAGGDLAYKKTGPRTGVWTDPTKLDKASWEFEEHIEKFLQIGENLVDPYVWGTYDVLVLPPSFPYGGMENANLTFLTPTLLAGDRSAVEVVAHEAAHSWFGNDVSCYNWDHFWLNEGWTTYLERLIIGQTDGGEAARGFSFLRNRSGLTEDLKLAKDPRYQRLVIPFEFGEDPDDSYSRVVYDKGSNFLLHLERTVGGLDIWLPYVRHYVKTFRGTSITTDQWKDDLFEYFKKNHGEEMIAKLNTVDWDAWLNGEGLEMPVDMKYDDSWAVAVATLAEKWDQARLQNSAGENFSSDDISSFSTNQLVYFVTLISDLPAFPQHLVKKMNELYDFNSQKNPEILVEWYEFALNAGLYKEQAGEWVGTVGRMKFCRPTYRFLYKVDPEFARATYARFKDFYHVIAAQMIEKDIQLTK